MSNIPFNLGEQHGFRLYGFDRYESGGRLDALPSFNPDHRTVIFLPGTRFNHEMRQRFIERLYTPGMIDLVKQVLSRHPVEEPLNILCAAYSHNDEQMIADHFSNTLNRDARVQPDNPAGADVHDFVDHVLLPYMGIEQGAHPDPDAVRQKLSRLTLVGHSFGTVFAAESARLLAHKLTGHGYSRDQAHAMVNEIVAINFINMARLDLAGPDEPHMRTVTFSATKDDTAWALCGRIAAEHIKDGLRDGPVETLEREYYTACGFDPALQDEGVPQRRGRGKVGAPKPVSDGYGRLALFDAPPQLSPEGKPPITPESLKKEAADLAEKLEQAGVNRIGINGHPLITASTMGHELRMGTYLCAENAEICNRFGSALQGAIGRGVQKKSPQESVGDIAAARTRRDIASGI